MVTDWQSGCLPGVSISTVSQPVTISGIYVSPLDPTLTASSIENAFTTFANNPNNQVSLLEGTDFGVTTATSLPEITATPVKTAADPTGLYTFDLEFGGDWAFSKVPLISVYSYNNAEKLTLSPTGGPLGTGNFRLVTDKGTTGNISFISTNLTTTAANIKSALVTLGYSNSTTVAVTPNGSNYDIVITFASNQWSWTLKYGAGTTSPLPATGTATITMSSTAAVTKIKESGDAFRVNPLEPDNPFTQGPDKFDQTDPAVAMDADGDFVITWTGEVSNFESPNSVTDIFGQMYTPTAYMSSTIWGVTDSFSVMPVEAPTPYATVLSPAVASAMGLVQIDAAGNILAVLDPWTFRVNAMTTNPQAQSSVGMDAIGDFTVAWASTGQDDSYFNGIYMQRFTKDGTPLNSVETTVNVEDTEQHRDPYVAVSYDGYVMILWQDAGALMAQMYQPDGSLFGNATTIIAGTPDPLNLGYMPSAAFDGTDPVGTDALGNVGDNIAISFTAYLDTDSTGQPSYGVYMFECSLNGWLNGVMDMRGLTRVNSADIGNGMTGFPPYWANAQTGGQVVMDVDGDMTIVYDGFGPDVAPDTDNDGIPGPDYTKDFYLSRALDGTLQGLLSAYASAPGTGLTTAQKTWLRSGAITFPFVPPANDFETLGTGTNDIDDEIDEILTYAYKPVDTTGGTNGGYGFSTTQIGQLQAILEQVAGLSRGDANASMYTQFDANSPNNLHVLATDVIQNTKRDGNNERDFVAFTPTMPLVTVAPDALPPTGSTISLTIQPADQSWPAKTITADVVYDLADVTTDNDGHIIGYFIDVNATLDALAGAIAANTILAGNVSIRSLPATVTSTPSGATNPITWTQAAADNAEVTWRDNTPWDIQPNAGPNKLTGTFSFIEVTFMNQLHDTPFVVSAPSIAGAAGAVVQYTQGNAGTNQDHTMVGITAAGSFNTVYLQHNLNGAGQTTSTSIYYRAYQESTDTAGPTVTAVMTDDGQDLTLGSYNGARRTSNLDHIVITVSKQMYDNLTATGNAVTNPLNYSLLDSNGRDISNLITKVYYGLSEGSVISGGTPSGRYEIVLELNGVQDSAQARTP